MSALPWYKRTPSEHMVAASDISLEEEGALLRMRDWQWSNGPLPADPAVVAKLIRAPRKSSVVAALLARFFTETEDGMVDGTLEAQRHQAIAKRSKLSKAGSMGAASRWTDDGMANAIANAIEPPMAKAIIRASRSLQGEGSTSEIGSTTTHAHGEPLRPAGGAR